MVRLNDTGINGILADEMGLGKTLQSISLLAFLRLHRKITGPHLVCVPKSVVGNWLREFGRWCPSIRCLKLLGTKEVLPLPITTQGRRKKWTERNEGRARGEKEI
jgi:SWI/SNF-related matrix-associated actin-dependent regulator of chromatin subfamily A member 5